MITVINYDELSVNVLIIVLSLGRSNIIKDSSYLHGRSCCCIMGFREIGAQTPTKAQPRRYRPAPKPTFHVLLTFRACNVFARYFNGRLS